MRYRTIRKHRIDWVCETDGVFIIQRFSQQSQVYNVFLLLLLLLLLMLLLFNKHDDKMRSTSANIVTFRAIQESSRQNFPLISRSFKIEVIASVQCEAAWIANENWNEQARLSIAWLCTVLCTNLARLQNIILSFNKINIKRNGNPPVKPSARDTKFNKATISICGFFEWHYITFSSHNDNGIAIWQKVEPWATSENSDGNAVICVRSLFFLWAMRRWGENS